MANAAITTDKHGRTWRNSSFKVPTETYERLEADAFANRRSVSAQLSLLIEQIYTDEG